MENMHLSQYYLLLCMSIYYSYTIYIHIFIFIGAQIIDLMMLVIDVTKGIQTQTAEVVYTYIHTYVRMYIHTEMSNVGKCIKGACKVSLNYFIIFANIAVMWLTIIQTVKHTCKLRTVQNVLFLLTN